MKQINQANRGKSLEDLVALANEQYLARGIAKVRKLPTPYRVQRIGKTMQAIPAAKSGLDYVGVIGGEAITFDCKQTRQASLPLKNIGQHQIDEGNEWRKHGGTVFWLVEYSASGRIYRVPHWLVSHYWRLAQNGGRKSIPEQDVLSYLVESQNGLVLDYLGGMYVIAEVAHG